MKTLDIKVNPITGGQRVVFQKGKEEFYADRSYVPYIGMETMIFPCKDGEVTSWTEVYCDRSGRTLEECVQEFINN